MENCVCVLFRWCVNLEVFVEGGRKMVVVILECLGKNFLVVRGGRREEEWEFEVMVCVDIVGVLWM